MFTDDWGRDAATRSRSRAAASAPGREGFRPVALPALLAAVRTIRDAAHEAHGAAARNYRRIRYEHEPAD